MLDAFETLIGPSPSLKIRTGSAPADGDAADSGTVLATLPLPADWMAAAALGVKAKSGTWSDTSADTSGTAAHYGLYTSGGTRYEQGSVTATSNGGDLTLDTITIVAGQTVTITGYTKTAPHP